MGRATRNRGAGKRLQYRLPPDYSTSPLYHLTPDQIRHGTTKTGALHVTKGGEALHYDYAPCMAYSVNLGMAWRPQDVPEIDMTFAEIGLTQEQFEAVLNLHAWRLKYFLSPKNYKAKQRLRMAAHFLFGGR